MNSADSSKEKLMSDLNQIIKDAEALLQNSEQQTGEGFKAAKARFEATLKNAKEEILRLEEAVLAKTKDAARVTDEYVKENPWQTAGVAAGVGLLLGLLIGRK
ncbi:DUF883 family protein [Undibacterium sp.]|jgi:ElaB/YqjD/DUF883 family membrane-anchored ribosome-binding protein|uniref:DUF883 family protein n=1 Tax=Undibacterium sp. TaxID=1914977 RepID=UPI002C828996|nr:DUF883 family protein [Undibacterium sp.]HTD06115.1 DUF883 family protein [Undibacterium sp.]